MARDKHRAAEPAEVTGEATKPPTVEAHPVTDAGSPPDSEAVASAPEPPAPPARPTKAAAARFRVWPHGELHYNGAVFKAGEELPITEAEAAMIGETAERFE